MKAPESGDIWLFTDSLGTEEHFLMMERLSLRLPSRAVQKWRAVSLETGQVEIIAWWENETECWKKLA